MTHHTTQVNMPVYTNPHRVLPHTGLTAAVGKTPLLPLQRLTANLSPRLKIFAKAEWFNPGGSVKDRPALSIIKQALNDGLLTPGKHLLDSTSGNMGIAYATFGAALRIPVTLILPANAGPERLTILKALGATLILTDPSEGIDGAIEAARKLAEEKPDLYYYACQYDNPANWIAHYSTTGPEIYDQTGGEITHFVAGLGTSGTLIGAGRWMRQVKPAVKIIAVQPDQPLHGLEGLKHMASAQRPGIFDPALPDRIEEVATETAYEMVQKLARLEGLFVGISSGAAAAAALRVASKLEEGIIVAVFPDSGYKYLSDQALWRGENP
jgi:S-sulfo-L-cysteine synthase (O-acetyl-L-serine-dependent)